MSTQTATAQPTRTFWIISVVALLWNLIGVATYLMSVTMTPDALAAMPEVDRALHESIPAWITSAYAIAVFTGLIGSILLLIRRAWAVPVFVVSLAAILVQMVYTILISDLVAVKGIGSAVFPIVIIGIGAYLVQFASSSRTKGWLR